MQTSNCIKSNSINYARAKALLDIEYELRQRKKAKELASTIELARSSFEGYVRYVRPSFLWNWHHVVMCEYLNQFARKEIENLIMLLPPRHSKTELCNRLLSPYIFGLNPDVEIVAASYASSLADEINRDVQNIMESELHLNVFPHAQIGLRSKRTDNSIRNSSKFNIVGHRGVYRSVGVRGSLTGKGYDYGMIDDPVKDHVEAMSPVVRRATRYWYDTVFNTRRMQENSGQLIVMTRWHEQDLVGDLLRGSLESAKATSWTVISLPAICTNPNSLGEQRELGEVLWGDKFSLEYMEKMKATSPWTFEAIYQQKPKPDGSTMFKNVYVYETLPESYKLVAGIDLAYSTSLSANNSVVFVGAVVGEMVYVLHVEQWKSELPQSIERLKQLQKQYPVAFSNENNGSQKGVNDVLVKAGIRINRIDRNVNKLIMSQPVAMRWNKGNIVLPVSEAGWKSKFLEVVLSFTGVNDAEDDAVDAMVNALLSNQSKSGIKV